MKGYNFEERNKDFDATVRLDKINEEVRRHEQMSAAETPKNDPKPEPKNKSKEVKSAPLPQKKKPFRYFTIAIIMICVAAFAIVFALSYRSLSSKAKDSYANYESTIMSESESKKEIKDSITVINGIIRDFPDNDKDPLIIYDISAGISRRLYPSENINLTSFHEGDLVDVSANLYSSTVENIKLSQSAFKFSSVSGLTLNPETSEITYEEKTYNTSEETLFVSKGEISDISLLDKNDIVTVSGIGDTIWYISAEKLHGSVLFQNASGLKNGVILFDEDLSFDITDGTSVNVPAGTHKVEIKGANINTYTTELFISSSETYNLDISKIPQKTGALSIKANVSDFYISIDGGVPSLYNTASPVVLSQGDHHISVSKEGYQTYEASISILSSYEIFSVNLRPTSASGFVTIKSSPPGAEVYVDDNHLGRTPLTTELTFETHRITLRKEDYKTSRTTLKIDQAEQSIEYILTPAEED